MCSMIYVLAGKIDQYPQQTINHHRWYLYIRAIPAIDLQRSKVVVSVRKLRRIVCVTQADLPLISSSDDKERHLNEFGT